MSQVVLQSHYERIRGPFNVIEKKYAPDCLYTSGDQRLFSASPRISIVGSRKASNQGLERASTIAKLIVMGNGVVVSGLAEGIDTAAHKGAIDNGGRTIAVIGTPLSQVYPKQNKNLQDEISKNHLLVSQFKTTTKNSFPLRNRTMALLSHATIIVEAGKTSGTKHQGWEAFRLGRKLYLPKEIVNVGYEWPEQMEDYGAYTYENIDDLINILLNDFPNLNDVRA